MQEIVRRRVEVVITGHIQTRAEFEANLQLGISLLNDNRHQFRAIVHHPNRHMEWQWCETWEKAKEWIEYTIGKYSQESDIEDPGNPCEETVRQCMPHNPDCLPPSMVGHPHYRLWTVREMELACKRTESGNTTNIPNIERWTGSKWQQGPWAGDQRKWTYRVPVDLG